MSLNACEDAFLRYLQNHADEKRFWGERVRALDRSGDPRETAAAALERELRAYAMERGSADAQLGEALGAGRVRLRNLAEHLLATWTPPRASPRGRRT